MEECVFYLLEFPFRSGDCRYRKDYCANILDSYSEMKEQERNIKVESVLFFPCTQNRFFHAIDIWIPSFLLFTVFCSVVALFDLDREGVFSSSKEQCLGSPSIVSIEPRKGAAD